MLIDKKEFALDKKLFNNYLDAKYKYKLERQMINFPINSATVFNDNRWDLTSLNVNERHNCTYILIYDSIPIDFIFHVKIHILNGIIKRKNRPSTCIRKITMVKSFLKFIKGIGITDAVLIEEDLLKKYINYCKDRQIKSISEIATELKLFIKTIEEIEGINCTHLIKYLNKVINNESRKRHNSSKNNTIPDFFLNKLTSLALKDINDSSCLLNNKIFACLLIILAETGMRVEELIMLETDKLDIRGIDEKQYVYLSFHTFKIEHKETYTWLTPLARKAYETCQKIVKDNFASMNEIKKYRLFHYYLTGKAGKFKPSKEDMNEIYDLDEKVLEGLQLRAIRYLWINCDTGRRLLTTSRFRDGINRFIVRHYKEMEFQKLTTLEKSKLKKFKVETAKKYISLLYLNEKENIKFEDVKNLTFYYANPHMFRVNVCTKLFEQNVHIDYIIKHLNHLSEDMTAYYNKSIQNIDRLKESIRVLDNITNQDGILEIKQKDLENNNFNFSKVEIEKINKFLRNNKLNIIEDSNKILKLLAKTSTTVEENEFGICIKSVITGLCDKKDNFNSIFDNTLFGMQLNTYRYLNNDYNRLKEKVKIYNHNIKIYSQDSMYTNELERETRVLNMFIDKNILKQIGLLEKDILKFGTKSIIRKHPNLAFITKNIDKIKREVKNWRIE